MVIQMSTKILEVKNLSKLYGKDKKRAIALKKQGKTKDDVYKQTKVTTALWDVSFDIMEKEIFVIIGLSGSGKSTLIRCLNLLNKPTSGEILFKGQDINRFNRQELRDYRRNAISMVFQSFGLMNHRSVLGNVEYGLEVKGVKKQERTQIAQEMIEMVGLEGLADEPISNLSGGMKQRVGIARALANDPDILLLDEPFSALDPIVRNDMQFELLQIQRKLDKTIIFITHDINEAFKIGDKVVIMKDGEVVQIDTPEDMSANPVNDYVRQFIEGADKTQVVTMESIMYRPNCIIRLNDNLDHAINQMRNHTVSSAYVLSDRTKLQGVVTLEEALRGKRENLKLIDVLDRDIVTAHKDEYVADILDKATQTRVPIAIVDEDNNLKGIVSKSQVLSSIK